MTRNKWIVVIIAAIVVLGGLVALSSRGSLDVSKVDTSKIITAGATAGGTKVEIGDHVFGNTTGKALLIEYGDFQCPYCGDLHPQLKPLTDYYKDSLTFVFRNFPLTTAHPNALAAATAAESVGLQGNDKYWEMHDTLYENQSQWSNADTNSRTGIFKEMAGSAGANVDTFMANLSDEKLQTKINFDKALGVKDKVDSTPTLILQGKNIKDQTGKAVNGDAADLETAIRNAIKDAGLPLPEKTYAESKNS